MAPATPTTMLYRPVGQAELDLIAASGFRRFPPRLPEQPIFYPVCNEEYAVQIAARWNTADGNVGYVTRFAVRSDFLAKYDVHIVGSRVHAEYWIPAEELEAFNDAIVGAIEVISEHRAEAHGPKKETVEQ
ncbi:ADP-ribosylation/crystallin J1 [Polyangium jinanense]|uniref:ADP-ribosylation/crystallin J1 n=1 Tax=Polyangium jinanense TaxID=2829994 RepID=A0A9X4AX37_9BACT|nr:ADP-ribosylation/crystallin J1 [Polyangium jinanense]MDC3985925.1 ADP-ribosylation/crystallin J1 [Polyangium jinanense]